MNRFIALKKTTLLLAFCGMAAVHAAPPKWEYPFQPEHPRKITIGKTPAVTLVSGGEVQFEIVTPKNASPTAKYAAQETARLLSSAVGKKLRVVEKASGKVSAIVIGDAALAKQAGIDLKKLDRDGFVIKTVGRNVLIIGRDHPTKLPSHMQNHGNSGERATLYGTYDFLERFAGIRFYFPGELGTVIPKLADWKLPEIDLYDRPDKVQRSHYASWRKTAIPAELGKPFNNQQFLLHMRIQSWTWACCHGLGKQGYGIRFGKDHPEYYARNIAGKSILEIRDPKDSHSEQFCFNTPIREEIYQDAISFLSGRPASERDIRPYRKNPKFVGWHKQLDPKVPIFDMTPNDGYYPCQCEKCRKIFSAKYKTAGPNRELSNFMWHYYAEGAKRVKDLGYIAAWIYWPTLWEPDFKLPDNILFVMCPRGPWSCGNENFFQAEKERIRIWGKITNNRMRLWNYMIKYPHGIYPGAPSMAPNAVAQYYKAVLPYTCGAFSEAGVDRFMFQYLNLYVYYKVLWDNDLNVKALLDEHYRLMFGAAASPMNEFFQRLEKIWLGVIGGAVDTPEGPKAIILSDHELWENRYSEAEMEELEKLIKAALSAVPKDSAEAKRVRLMEREIWQVLKNARDKYRQSQDLKKCWNLCAAEAADPVVIDGSLKDAAWKKAQTVYLTRFKKDVVEVNTRVKMLYDQENLYFGFECDEPDTANMIVQPMENDVSDRWTNSTVEIFLNPDGTGKNYYQLMVDPSGKLNDYYSNNGVLDIKWNSGAEIKTSVVDGKKWIAEIKLPRKSLNEVKNQFPVNFFRHRARKSVKESYIWNPFMSRLPEVDKWGSAILGPDPNPSIIKYGDFEMPIRNKRWIGPWYGVKLLEADQQIYLTGGASMKLRGGKNMSVTQRFKLKPKTTYEVSFFVKLDKVGLNYDGGVRARFDECGGNVTWIPKGFLRGTLPWTRVSKIIKTSPQCGTKRKGPYTEYLSIHLSKKDTGTAWIDHVEIREVKDTK